MPRVVVYLRFARPREGVKDPPLVRWTAAKERELWGMLRASSTDLDWAALARHFDVSLVYILQQAAWLYEKELGLLRRKMSQINMPPAGASLAALRPAAQPDSPRSDTAPGSAAGSAAGSLSLDEFEDSGSDVAPAPSRRLLSASRIAPLLADSASESDSDSSMDAFLPAARIESRRSELSSSFSDNSVSQSALEEALLEQVSARRRAEARGGDSPTSPASPASPAAPASPQASTQSTQSAQTGPSAAPTP